MHRLPVLALLFVTLVSAAPGGQTPEGGSVVGVVTITTRVPGKAIPSTAYPTRAIGPHEGHPIPEMSNVVVYLKEVTYRAALPMRKAVMRQEHETFVPHTLPIARGSTVDFPNDDPIFHNVFSLSRAAAFDLGRYPQGRSKPLTFTKAGIVKVFCHIHSHMSATILVFDHPYFVVPEANGAYELANIPPGQYTVVGWHERIGERTTTIRVERGKATTVNLSLPVQEPQ